MELRDTRTRSTRSPSPHSSIRDTLKGTIFFKGTYDLAQFDVKALARRGAEARIQELSDELESIYKIFPDLRGQKRARSGTPAASNEPDSAPSAKVRKRSPMTAAQRKAVGERMK